MNMIRSRSDVLLGNAFLLARWSSSIFLRTSSIRLIVRVRSACPFSSRVAEVRPEEGAERLDLDGAARRADGDEGEPGAERLELFLDLRLDVGAPESGLERARVTVVRRRRALDAERRPGLFREPPSLAV